MKRIREFADSVGCTAQNIYLHLDTYKEQLEGHVHKGSRGKVLDDYACEFLRSVMNPKEISADNQLMEEVNKLRALLVEANTKNSKLVEELSGLKTENYKLQQELSSKETLLLETQDMSEALQVEYDTLTEDLEKVRETHRELVDSNEKLKEHYQELGKDFTNLQKENLNLVKDREDIKEELEKERTRKLSMSERFFGYKKR